MDKVVGKLNSARLNMWQAFKQGINVKGYNYYKPPPELKYRYPAPGSCALEEVDHPNLYKKHWKTPYRESPYNIQKKEKKMTDDIAFSHYISDYPKFDPTQQADKMALREQQPSEHGVAPLFDQMGKSIEEQRSEIWQELEGSAKNYEQLCEDYSGYVNDLEQDYYPLQLQYREREFSGFENDPINKEMIVEMEYFIEEMVGKKRITEKKMNMLKGTPKKWQILDDDAFDREQIEKIQAAARAPLPDELELYQEKHSKPMQLPINNANVSKWRDDQRAIDGIGADFDPKLIEQDRERRKKYFLERFEKPVELNE